MWKKIVFNFFLENERVLGKSPGSDLIVIELKTSDPNRHWNKKR
jgi:hypothetical protein